MFSQKSSPSPLTFWTRALQYSTRRGNAPGNTLLSVIENSIGVYGDRLALCGETERLTYAQLVDRSLSYGNWAVEYGLHAGDVVGLVMHNTPDYVAIWLGLTEIGCVVALFNTNLQAGAIAHAITAADCKLMVVEASLLAPVAGAVSASARPVPIVLCGSEEIDGFANISAMREPACGRLRATAAELTPRRCALLVFTSGTTGLPKATRISHGRILEWSFWFAGMMGATCDDRLYNCLPLYHSTGGIVAIGAMLTQGGSVEIRRRFSASAFWEDITRSGCTIFQYIGEVCRYLTQAEPSRFESEHRVRLFCGNGLSGETWSRVVARFGVPRVLEFYAATEGGLSLYNCEGRIGSIGRIPPFLRDRLRVRLIKVDPETGDAIRTRSGLCQLCAPDEPGEAISELPSSVSESSREFEGYTDESASARKIICDVVVPGDRWFRSGDLMRCDAEGFFYFVDRLGDSFRWKGENVSSTEVANVVAGCQSVTDTVVYGVTLDGVEGQAGMAALVVSDDFTFVDLKAVLTTGLPDYAEPLFVRICETIEATGTSKLVKGQLRREGIQGALESGKLWFNDRHRQAFVPCDRTFLARIAEGVVRV